ncbi:MAG: methyltransferase domain-containing protein [Rhodovibrionaceae bacterium]
MDAPQLIFDRRAVRRHRERAAAGWEAHDFLVREAAERLAERLPDIKRAFPLALDLGCHGGELRRALAGRGGIETLIQSDPAAAFATRAAGGGPAVVAEEDLLPFAAGRFDLVLSSLSLHWVNDLPGALLQIRQALKPDGLLLASLLGGDTLWELRRSLMRAEAELSGGASPRVSPFVELRDAAGLLQRAGFALPVADVDRITVSYPDPLALLRELRAMGESNALAERPRGVPPRELLPRAAALYMEEFAGEDGRVPATFELVTLTAWSPHESQPQPLRPGSAEARLAEALGTEEKPAGDKAAPRKS